MSITVSDMVLTDANGNETILTGHVSITYGYEEPKKCNMDFDLVQDSVDFDTVLDALYTEQSERLRRAYCGQ